MYTNAFHSSVGKGRDLVSAGTWVRFPGPPYNLFSFFIKRSHAAYSPMSHHTASRMACQVALMINLKATEWSPGYGTVNQRAHKHGKSNEPCASGPELLQLTSPLGLKPPWFAFFNFYFLFFS